MEVKELGINEIRVGYHPRKGFGGNEELKNLIQKNGLTDPIRVRPEGDHFVVIDGIRRLQVAKDLGWETVPCIVEEIDEKTGAHHSYLRNCADCRKNLNSIEVALHIKEMRDRFGYSILDLVGLEYAKDDQTLYNKLALLSLPEEIQSQIAEGAINPTEGYRLAAVKDAGLQKKAAEIVLASKNRSVRKTEKIIKTLIASVNRPESENAVPGPSHEGDIPGVFFHDSGDMHEFEDGTIPLIIVSPSYGVGMEYEEGVSFEQHLADLERCVPEWGRKLMPGGHLCINFGDIHNFGSKNGTEPEIELMGHVFQGLLRPLNIRLRDTIVWDKGLPWVNNRQVIPYIDTPHTEYRLLNSFEHIYIFKKDGKRELPLDSALKSTITKAEWNEWISGVWKIRTVPSQKDHPAQFPEELPRRLIKMFSCEGDIVVDTALGSGTTIKVARELNRKGYGYERDIRYKPVIMKKLGVKDEDLKKSTAKEPSPELTTEERKREIGRLASELVPQIITETMEKGALVASISCPLKRNLSKDDLIVKTVATDGHLPPTPTIPPFCAAKADDYEHDGEPLPGNPGDRPQSTMPSPDEKKASPEHINKIILGDCLDKLKDLPDNSVDLIATDPPYGLKFMGKIWDRAVPSEDIWKECLRVLKPGAFAFIMCAPRQDCLSRMISHLEHSGFDTGFTSLYWTYAQGFPKALDVGKKVERLKGANGGFQPKPAVEVIIVAMKPMDEKTYSAQALKNGKGVTWMNDCRIPCDDKHKLQKAEARTSDYFGEEGKGKKQTWSASTKGRFPANLLISDSALDNGKEFSRYFSLDSWVENNLPFLVVPKASKKEKNLGLEGFQEKSVNDGRQKPIDNPFQRGVSLRKNTHPTVKPIKLMAYLITMGSREGDVVLDCFAGSGSTCVAAKLLERKFVGIELDSEYQKIAKKRVETVAVAKAA